MYKKVLLFYSTVMGIGLIFSACCEQFFTVTSDFTVSFTDFNLGTPIDPTTDTIRTPFIYSLDAVIVAENTILHDLDPFPSAYALSCSETYLNPYLKVTASLILDKSFFINGHNIMPGTNLLTLDEEFKEGEVNVGVYDYTIRVWFNQSFIDKAWFPVDTYTFTASVQMQDGTVVTSTDAIVIDLPY